MDLMHMYVSCLLQNIQMLLFTASNKSLSASHYNFCIMYMYKI